MKMRMRRKMKSIPLHVKLSFVALLLIFAGASAFIPNKETACPSAEIDNEHVRMRLYLPDSVIGYYRATRFDWSGVIYSLTS